ncbi:PST family polysaccharide transporter/teichuronic acid exporter [Paenibacillus cellulosilyticus]|uniref:PST family polysaccharide transporter/teichuronic acid exporter n=1 Tax=Paenibacillus cellulosilyticus TaxID=375489 RepID=A0A2V2YKL6_9BACL|nr:MOP flippase family protein [Paenibacillus cellulosilyticus]PWV93812.1 PST family polysaccharide transporter/teichuronic acid exporter [Paenibacillus cellulosilyticus]QKS47427.1 MOP flippase family protein [Paenibacillus cellulosilyticus]
MSLKQKGAAASKWTSLSTIVVTLVQFAQLAILSRLLNPSDYGIMGMITVVVGFAQIYSDVGISNAIIYRQDISRQQLSSLYYLNVLSGVLVLLVVLAVSPLIAWFYNEPKLLTPLWWVSLIFIIIPIGQQYQVLCQKELKFNQLAIFDILSYSLGLVVAITSAWMQAGVMSLVLGQLTVSSVKTLCLVLVGMRSWKPGFHFKFNEVKEFIKFGAYQMGEKTIHFFSTNIDYIIIGKMFGTQVLGYYTFAYQLAIIPVMKINPVVTQVALPIFARIQHEKKKLREGYLTVLQYLSMINFPIYAGLIIASPLFIPIMFGDKWNGSILFIQVLSLMGLIRSTIQPNNSLLLAIGRADLSFKWTVISMFVLLPSIGIGVTVGQAEGIAWGYVVAQCILSFMNYRMIRRVIRTNWLEYSWVFIRPLSYCLCMMGYVWGIRSMSQGAPIVKLVLVLIGAVLLYSLLTWIFSKSVVREILRLVLKKTAKTAVEA